jgi:predicted nucleic acid-binding protein
VIGLDSSIFVGLLRNKIPAEAIRKHANEGLCTSEIVVYEIIYGLYASSNFSEKKLWQFEALLDGLVGVFAIDRKASIKAAQIGGELSKRGERIGHTDALIAGSLMANGCTKLVTGNSKEFEKIKGLSVLPIYSD